MSKSDDMSTAKKIGCVVVVLTDTQGYLRTNLTPDGLHPALRGKMIIGETIGNYLRKTFADKL